MILPERLKNLTDDELKELVFTDFLKSELIELIEETILSDLDKAIAILKFTKLKTNEEIAEEVQYDPKTVRTHSKLVQEKLTETLLKLPKTKELPLVEDIQVN